MPTLKLKRRELEQEISSVLTKNLLNMLLQGCDVVADTLYDNTGLSDIERDQFTKTLKRFETRLQSIQRLSGEEWDIVLECSLPILLDQVFAALESKLEN